MRSNLTVQEETGKVFATPEKDASGAKAAPEQQAKNDANGYQYTEEAETAIHKMKGYCRNGKKWKL